MLRHAVNMNVKIRLLPFPINQRKPLLHILHPDSGKMFFPVFHNLFRISGFHANPVIRYLNFKHFICLINHHTPHTHTDGSLFPGRKSMEKCIPHKGLQHQFGQLTVITIRLNLIFHTNLITVAGRRSAA